MGTRGRGHRGTVVRVLAANNHLTLACSRRKVLEHLGYAFVEILFILVGFVGEHTFGAPPPNQLLGLPVVQVDDQRTFLVILFDCG